jgi:hypothetical protein
MMAIDRRNVQEIETVRGLGSLIPQGGSMRPRHDARGSRRALLSRAEPPRYCGPIKAQPALHLAGAVGGATEWRVATGQRRHAVARSAEEEAMKRAWLSSRPGTGFPFFRGGSGGIS